MIGNYDNKNVTVHAISLHQKISLAVPQPNPRKKRYSTDKTNPTQVMYLHILGAHALTRIRLQLTVICKTGKSDSHRDICSLGHTVQVKCDISVR